MNKFNVGDTVFDLRYGFGVVVDFPQNTIIFDKSEPPVKFEKDLIYYTKDGKYSYTDFAPSLLTLEEAAKLGYYPELNSNKTISITEKQFDEAWDEVGKKIFNGPCDFMQLLKNKLGFQKGEK